MTTYVHFTLGEKMKFVCPVIQGKEEEPQCRAFLGENSFPVMGKKVENIRPLIEKELVALEKAVAENDNFWDAQNQVCYRSDMQYLDMLEEFLSEKDIDLMGEPTEEEPLHRRYKR